MEAREMNGRLQFQRPMRIRFQSMDNTNFDLMDSESSFGNFSMATGAWGNGLRVPSSS